MIGAKRTDSPFGFDQNECQCIFGAAAAAGRRRRRRRWPLKQVAIVFLFQLECKQRPLEGELCHFLAAGKPTGVCVCMCECLRWIRDR